MDKKHKNNQVVIAFDLHEVIFSFSYIKFFDSSYKFFEKNPYALTLANPFAGYRILNTLYATSKTAENVYNRLTEKHYPWLAASKTEFLLVCNSYILDPEMKKLLDELESKGYRLAVCSNIGSQAFEHFKNEHPDIFNMFEIIVTSHPERNYMRKPAQEFFDHFKKDVQQAVPQAKYCVFIDDKKRNVQAAEKLGIHGVVFKNPKQLRKELKDLGINVSM
ncbi:MAG: HAD-IA family hydrolase [Candidatus Babeliaceae bacterium]|nr:HAD-IA family hydrolase [Candidatus Babeliaceae bacterium]